MKLFLPLFILFLISSCATRCYTVEFLDVSYKDLFNNELIIRSRGMFTKELDTTFIKDNITGLTLNHEQPNDSIRFEYDIHQVEKIGSTVYLLHISTKRITNKKTIDEGCKYYLIRTEKTKGKMELKELVSGVDCYFPIDKKKKKSLSKKMMEKSKKNPFL